MHLLDFFHMGLARVLDKEKSMACNIMSNPVTSTTPITPTSQFSARSQNPRFSQRHTCHDYQSSSLMPSSSNPELDDLTDAIEQLYQLTTESTKVSEDLLRKIQTTKVSIPQSMSCLEIISTFLSDLFSKVLSVFSSIFQCIK